MSTLAIIIVIAAFIGVFVGIIGTVIPFLPGVPLVLFSAFILGAVDKFTKITPPTLILLAGLAVLAFFLNAIFIAHGVRKSGGAWNGLVGATFGFLIGLVTLNIVGAAVGFLVGLVVGEIISGTPLSRIPEFVKSAFMAMFLSSVIELIIAIVMAVIVVVKYFL